MEISTVTYWTSLDGRKGTYLAIRLSKDRLVLLNEDLLKYGVLGAFCLIVTGWSLMGTHKYEESYR